MRMRSQGARAAAVGLVALMALAGCGSSSSAGTGSSTSAKPLPTSTDPTQAVIGLTVLEAQVWGKVNGWTIRVTEIDGQPQPATQDLREDRVNVATQDGVITKATIG